MLDPNPIPMTIEHQEAQVWLDVNKALDTWWQKHIYQANRQGSLYTLLKQNDTYVYEHLCGDKTCMAQGITWRHDYASWRKGTWTLGAPLLHHLNRFNDWSIDFINAIEPYKQHIVLYDGERLLGHLLLAHCEIDPTSVQNLRKILLQRANIEGTLGQILTTSTGRLLSWCNNTEQLITKSQWPSLLEVLRDHLDENKQNPSTFGSFTLEPHRMMSQQRSAFLWYLTRAQSLTLNPFSVLNPTQHFVCKNIHMTNQQLASSLHLSVDGVKYHLKQVYQQLSLSNKTELAALYAQYHDDGDHVPRE